MADKEEAVDRETPAADVIQHVGKDSRVEPLTLRACRTPRVGGRVLGTTSKRRGEDNGDR
jgi:hypothetical protein